MIVKVAENRKLTRKKKVLFYIITLLALFLILELSARTYFAFKVGPSVFLYGTPFHRKGIQVPETNPEAKQIPGTRPEAKNYVSGLEWTIQRTVITHTNKLDGYSKYFQNQKRLDFDIETGESFDVTINNRGFRGRDFADQKEPGVIRIVALGASSTFGYFDRDDETYPVYLEQMLNDRYSGKLHFEVINMGIPHLTAENIYALFLAEVIQLNPDIVTFYEGNNDVFFAIRYFIRSNKGVFSRFVIKAGKYSIVVGFVNSIFDIGHKTRYSPAEIQKLSSTVSNNFINNVSRIHQGCNERDILFVLANQQKNSQTIDREKMKGITYEEEVEEIRARLLQSEQIWTSELKLLMHAVLMKDLATFAKSKQLPFVDVIARLDQDRDVMVSWVHLSPRGNRMVAEAFADEILKHTWNPRPTTHQE